MIPALVDSAANPCFISPDLLRSHTHLLNELPAPLNLKLFNGSLANQIQHFVIIPIIFADGTTQRIPFLVTPLDSSAQIVLGLPWLQEYNPIVDWANLTLQFRTPDAKPLSLDAIPKIRFGTTAIPPDPDPTESELLILREIAPWDDVKVGPDPVEYPEIQNSSMGEAQIPVPVPVSATPPLTPIRS